MFLSAISTPRHIREDGELASAILALPSKSRCRLAQRRRLSELSMPEDSSALPTSRSALENRRRRYLSKQGKEVFSRLPAECQQSCSVTSGARILRSNAEEQYECPVNSSQSNLLEYRC